MLDTLKAIHEPAEATLEVIEAPEQGVLIDEQREVDNDQSAQGKQAKDTNANAVWKFDPCPQQDSYIKAEIGYIRL